MMMMMMMMMMTMIMMMYTAACVVGSFFDNKHAVSVRFSSQLTRFIHSFVRFETQDCKKYCAGIQDQPQILRYTGNLTDVERKFWRSICEEGCHSGLR